LAILTGDTGDQRTSHPLRIALRSRSLSPKV